jgi:hypothetical protein
VDSIQIFIPGDIDAIERGRRFETLINSALRKAGRLGRSTGGSCSPLGDIRITLQSADPRARLQ